MKIILTLNPATHSLKHLWRSVLMLALLTLLCWSFPVAQAAPGDVDATFAGFTDDGIVIETDLSMSVAEWDSPNGIALQPDGKIVTLGQNGPNLVLFRYLPNGQRDGTFGSEGKVEIPAGAGIVLHPTDVALQPDGKIVVAGRTTATSFDPNSDFLLLRLTVSGELDPSFGPVGGGFAITDFRSDADSAQAVLIQPDGKIVVCGGAEVDGDGDFGVARYLPNGAPDPSFSGDGKTAIGFGGEEDCRNMALQNDGKLVLVGSLLDYNILDDLHYDFGLARLEINGTLDDTSNGDGGFDGDGKVFTDFGDDENAQAVTLQPDGKIVVLGYDDDPDTSYIARYLPTGKLDGTFGSGGKRTIPVDSLFDLVLQPDGKLLALGYHESPDGDRKFALYRLLSNGAPDTTFNNGGVAWLDFGGYDVGADLALLPDGRILAFGWSGYSRLILARLWPDGTTFDTGGQQAHGLSFPPHYQPGYRETVNGMALQPDGAFLVAGQVRNPAATRGDAFVTRFKANGLPDTSFGANGSAFIFGPDPFRAATAVAAQPDGKIVIAGYTAYNKEHTAMDFMVARFLPTGGIDLNFGTGGVTTIDFVGGADKATALALAPDGKIVVAGPIEGTHFIWGVARLTASGQLDGNFNGGGKAYVDFPGRNGVNAVLVQPDRKIILGGYREANPDQAPGDTDFALARLTESGALDPSFGPTAQGIVTTQIGGRDRINALALAPNGFIYAGGYREIGVYRDFALMQYQPNGLKATCAPGAPCTNWPGGRYVSGLGGDDWINALALRADGQLAAAGCLEGHFGGVQLRTDGDPIPTQLLFNTDFVGSPDCAKAVMFVGGNKIIMAGDQDLYPFSSDSNIALARFETTANTSGPTPIPAPNPNPTRGPVYLPIILR